MLRTLKIALLALVLTLALPTNAYADTKDSTATVNINTSEPVDSVAPVDPSNPTVDRDIVPGSTDPIDVLNPETGNEGALTVDTVPSFVFQEHRIVNTQDQYFDTFMGTGPKTLYSSYDTPYVQVSDRRGTGTGWNLALKATEMVAYDGATAITGFATIPYTLTLKTQTANPIGQKGFVLGSHIPAIAPIAPATIFTISGNGTPTDRKLLSAEVGKGLGTWILRFQGESEGSSINFNTDLARINGSATTTQYKSTLTWTLSDAPGN